MSRNNLKRFPTAMLRRGLAHFHPCSSAPGSGSPGSGGRGGTTFRVGPGPAPVRPEAPAPPDARADAPEAAAVPA